MDNHIRIRRKEAQDLTRFLMTNGYISHEKHPEIHVFLAKLVQFVGLEFVNDVLQENNRDHRTKIHPKDLERERA